MNVGLFADVGNLYYCIGKAFPGRKLDYQKYWDAAMTLAGETPSIVARAYGTQLDREAVPFISALKHIGYETQWRRESPDGRRVSWNVGIACDALDAIASLDVIIIGSGDSNLVELLQALKRYPAKIIVFASRISRDLKIPGIEIVEITEELLEVRE